MAVATLDGLFHETLKDIYYAEKKLLKVLPKMAKEASSEDLSQAFEDHLGETEDHVRRIEKVFELIGKPPRTKKCEAIEGMVQEGEDVIDGFGDSVRDAGLISAGQAVEHYEIARYGTLIAWASALGNDEAANLLSETLEEEKNADKHLTELAQNINTEAQQSAAAA